MVHQLSVTLEDLYNGATRKLALQKNVICDKCEGALMQKLAVGQIQTKLSVRFDRTSFFKTWKWLLDYLKYIPPPMLFCRPRW